MATLLVAKEIKENRLNHFIYLIINTHKNIIVIIIYALKMLSNCMVQRQLEI